MSRLQPRPKALATSNLSSQSASASARKEVSSPKSPVLQSQKRPLPTDPISERATLFLIRRTLCSQLGEKGRSTPAPIDELLPPLTSSNDVDVQLYAFIAIIIREFVQTWYTKITPDHVFVEEVVKIIAHCTRALEQRLRKVDLESLLFDELPDLLDVHVKAYRTSHYPIHPSPLEANYRQIYHSLWPFPALSPVPDALDPIATQQQAENEAAYRQLLVQGVLAVLLPTEDLENDCLRTLVGQILSEMILGGGIGGKASESWLIWEGITKMAEAIKAQLPKSKAQARVERSKLDAAMSIPLDINIGVGEKKWRIGQSLQKTLWLSLQYVFVAFTTLRFVIVSIASSSSLPARIPAYTKITGSASAKDVVEAPGLTNTYTPSRDHIQPPLKQPIPMMKLWSCLSGLLDLEVRMPWLSATISLLQWKAINGPGGLGNTDGMIDKFLSHAIQIHVLDPTHLPPLLRTLRAALFPNNTLAPPRAIPSTVERLGIRRRCAETLLELIPVQIQSVYFGIPVGPVNGAEDLLGERRVAEVEEMLDIFSDPYCNRHLIYGIVELIIVRLVPELAENGIEELLNERLSS